MSYNESLDPNSNYPLMSQSEWDNAPWNEKENERLPVEVTISVTLSKTVTIYTDKYEYYNDGECEGINIDDATLEKEVNEQVILPQEAYKYINGNTNKGKIAIEDLKDWDVDDFVVEKD